VVIVLKGEGYYYKKTAIELSIIVYTEIISIIIYIRIISIIRFLEVSSASFNNKDFISNNSGSKVVNRGGINIKGFSNMVMAIH